MMLLKSVRAQRPPVDLLSPNMRYNNHLLQTIGLLFFSLLLSFSSNAADKIVIGTGLKPPLVSSEIGAGFLDTLAKEMFKRIDIELEVIVLPAERALINANRGIEDGNLLRIKGLEKRYPNLIRVPEKMMDSEFVGYALKEIPAKQGWQRLSDQIVTFPKGWKIFETHVSAATKVEQVSDPTQMFHLLRQGKADVALYEKWQGILQAKNAGLTDYQVLEPSFITMEMFMYLNKRHGELVPKVAAALREMKSDGTYDQIFQETLGTL